MTAWKLSMFDDDLTMLAEEWLSLSIVALYPHSLLVH